MKTFEEYVSSLPDGGTRLSVDELADLRRVFDAGPIGSIHAPSTIAPLGSHYAAEPLAVTSVHVKVSE
jgi:hypothetical protein